MDCAENVQNVETYTQCFDPDLNYCLLDAAVGLVVVRFLQLPLYIVAVHDGVVMVGK